MTRGLPPSQETVLHLKAKEVFDSSPAPPHRNHGFLNLRATSETKKSVFTRSARFWALYVPILALFLSFSYFLTNHVSSWAPFGVNEGAYTTLLTLGPCPQLDITGAYHHTSSPITTNVTHKLAHFMWYFNQFFELKKKTIKSSTWGHSYNSVRQ